MEQPVDMKAKALTTRRGAALAYDYIVFATGAVARPELMPGLREGSLNFHTGAAEAAKIWEAIQPFKSGTAVVAITSVPHKCPPSPNEAAFLFDEFLRKRGIRESVKIKFLTPYPRAYPAEHISKVVQDNFREEGNRARPVLRRRPRRPSGKEDLQSRGRERGLRPAYRRASPQGGPWSSDSGIGDEEGWISADKHTMKMKDHPEAYAIGDATNIPTSKSGVVAHLQAEAVAKNVAAEIRGSRRSSSTMAGSTVRWRPEDGRCSSPGRTRARRRSSRRSCDTR